MAWALKEFLLVSAYLALGALALFTLYALLSEAVVDWWRGLRRRRRL